MKLQAHDLSFFLGKNFFGGDASQNTLVCQRTRDALDLKIGKGIDYVFSWKSNGVHTFKFIPLYTAFLHSIKLSRCKVEKQFIKLKSKTII